jgi:hypothetical protein
MCKYTSRNVGVIPEVAEYTKYQTRQSLGDSERRENFNNYWLCVILEDGVTNQILDQQVPYTLS